MPPGVLEWASALRAAATRSSAEYLLSPNQSTTMASPRLTVQYTSEMSRVLGSCPC